VITEGSIAREQAVAWFPFLAKRFRGRRKAIKAFTHRDPDFVFWVYPDGRLFDAREAHRQNYPRGFGHILDDEPDYGGFLRGRVATDVYGQQLVVVYCVPEALVDVSLGKIEQLLTGLADIPVPLGLDALVISDNADIFGTVDDLRVRLDMAR
jgi:hypothetical protein